MTECPGWMDRSGESLGESQIIKGAIGMLRCLCSEALEDQ